MSTPLRRTLLGRLTFTILDACSAADQDAIVIGGIPELI